MSRIWNTVYSDTRPDTNEAYSAAYQPISIPAAKWAMVKVPFPPECRIGRIVVKQLSVARDGGTAVGFSVTAYNLPVIPVANDSAVALPDNAPLYEVIPTKTATATNVVRDFTPEVGGDGFLFRNAVKDYTDQERYLYVLIVPSGAGGTTKWEMAFTALEAVGTS